MRRPLFKTTAGAAAAGAVLLVAAAVCLHDAWEARGQRPPWPVRVVSWW